MHGSPNVFTYESSGRSLLKRLPKQFSSVSPGALELSFTEYRVGKEI
jgi:hypothetical protein